MTPPDLDRLADARRLLREHVVEQQDCDGCRTYLDEIDRQVDALLTAYRALEGDIAAYRKAIGVHPLMEDTASPDAAVACHDTPDTWCGCFIAGRYADPERRDDAATVERVAAEAGLPIDPLCPRET